MNKRIYFKGLDHTQAYEDHVNSVIKKIESFITTDKTPQSIEVVLDKRPTHAHNTCEIRISSPSYRVIVSKEGEDLYKLIDLVGHIAYEELHRQKERQVDKDKHGCVEDCTELLKRQLGLDKEAQVREETDKEIDEFLDQNDKR